MPIACCRVCTGIEIEADKIAQSLTYLEEIAIRGEIINLVREIYVRTLQ